MRIRRPRRAVTLIEAVLFIAVALGLIVGGLVLFQQAQTASRTQQTVRLVSALWAELDVMYRNAGGFFGFGGPILEAWGAIPSDATYDNHPHCNIKAPWGACIQVSHTDLGGIDFIFYEMPEAICARLAQFDTDGSSAFGDQLLLWRIIIREDVNGPAPNGINANLFQHYPTDDGPLTPAMGGEACVTHQTGRDDRAVLFLFDFPDPTLLP